MKLKVNALSRWLMAIMLIVYLAPSMAEDGPDTNTDSSMQNMPETMDGGAMPDDKSAQDTTDHETMNHDAMNHDSMNHESMNMDQAATMDHSAMDHNAMNPSAMNHAAMTQQQAAQLRDPNAYALGYTLENAPYTLPGPRLLRMGDEHAFFGVKVDRLEARNQLNANVSDRSGAFDLEGFYGRDYRRLVFKSEGVYDNAGIEESSVELLWQQALTPFWNSRLGMRHDKDGEVQRDWLALGLEGLAPYWIETTATLYLADQGRSALEWHGEYDILLTQRLILQPSAGLQLFGKDDSERGIGAGLSAITIGLRLRYEFQRELALYAGVEWDGLYGDSAVYAETAGQDKQQTQAVSGLQLRF